MTSVIEALHTDAAENPILYGGTVGVAAAQMVQQNVGDIYCEQFADIYGAHFLQELYIANLSSGQTEIGAIATGGLIRDMRQQTINLQTTALRFEVKGNTLKPHLVEPNLNDLSYLPEFNETSGYRNRRILYVGMGGGSDVIQASAVSKIMERRFPDSTAGLVSVRGLKRQLTGETIPLATNVTQITTQTRASGDRRFLEPIPLETDPTTPVFLVDSTETGTVSDSLTKVIRHTQADMVVGVDTGGDGFSDSHLSFSAPYGKLPRLGNQDARVVSALAQIARDDKRIVARTFTVAPGIDGPADISELLATYGGHRLVPDEKDRELIVSNYSQWRMDGTGNHEGRYGKTNLTWLIALNSKFGLNALELPHANILDRQRPWRSFLVVTRAMADIVVMDAERHDAALRNN